MLTSSSILHGLLGKWVDRRLQPVCRSMLTYLKSSYKLKTQLSSCSFDAQRVSFFTADAVSMYTNIDTDHTLSVIAQFLRTHPICQSIYNIDSINRGLEILMRNNLFKFGNTYWLQLEGTAMGTPPACMYTTLYFAIYELELLTYFIPLLHSTDDTSTTALEFGTTTPALKLTKPLGFHLQSLCNVLAN